MAGSKLLAQLNKGSREQLGHIAEAGMGYYIVNTRLEDDDQERICIIGGDFYVIPMIHSTYFSLNDLIEDQPFPTNIQQPENNQPEYVGMEILSFASTIDLSEFELSGFRVPPVPLPNLNPPPASQPTVKLPQGYTNAFGAIPLLGTIKLKYVTNFYRYTGSQFDPCFNGTELSAGTYLTPANDIGYANTGFAAVGRYALPIPAPASYQHLYQLPIGTNLKIGTVLPNYGQAGGGVEVRLTGKEQVTWFSSTQISDY